MQYTFDHDLHVHSYLSTCSRDEGQTPECILSYAKENGLHTVCLTNHFWDETVPGADAWYAPQNYGHLTSALPLPQAEGVRFLFGCETELDQHLRLGLSRERQELFDFIVIPVTHFHKVGFTISSEEAATAESRAATWLRRVRAVLEMDLPFSKIGLAHLACPLISRDWREEYVTVLRLLPQTELEDIFSFAARVGVGIEINTRDFLFEEHEADAVLRIFQTAKECGCKFYLGSDAHFRTFFETAKMSFSRAIDRLSLTEDDKFYLH